MAKQLVNFPTRRAQSRDERAYILLHHRLTGEEFIYKAGKFHGKGSLWLKHLEWIKFISLLGKPRHFCPMTVIAHAIASSRFWEVDEYCAPYHEPGVIYG